MGDYYELLEVSPNASEEEITKAYRHLVARYHPDKHQGNELSDLAEEKMAALNTAYETLINREKRAAYDAERRGTGGYRPSTPLRPIPEPTSLFPWGRVLLLVAIAGGAYLSMRFVRNPRMAVIIAAVIALIWFGPRIWKLFRR